jgi:hypothetical protein
VLNVTVSPTLRPCPVFENTAGDAIVTVNVPNAVVSVPEAYAVTDTSG